MTHEHEHHAGHLAFPNGGVVTGALPSVEVRIAAGEHVLAQEVASAPGSDVETVPGTVEQAAHAWTAHRGRPYEGQEPPEGAHLMPSGHWVQMADPRTLTRNAKRQIISGGQRIEEAAERAFYITDELHKRLITAWSYPEPLPSADVTALGRLPLEDDEPLADLLDDARAVLFPRTEVSPDDHADPASPTGPSGA